MISLMVVGNVFMAVVTIFKINRLPPQIPLFYTRPWGEGQLADTWLLVLIPLSMNAALMFNNFVLRKYFQNNDLLKKVFNYLNFFTVISFVLIFTKIVFLVS